jgi:GT2 family glycosyltransferase
MKQGLSVIIVNYYSENYIIPLVETIVSNIKLANYEIIIISNSPSNFKWEDAYLKKNYISIIENGKNDGFGIGVNKGVEYSKYNYFCMLNPDIKINKNTLDELYDFFQTVNDDVGAISCMIKNSDGSRQNTFFMDTKFSKKAFTLLYIKNIFPNKLRNLLFKENNKKESFDFTKPFEVGGFYCPFVMMKKSAFLDVGGFDPDFFMYAEDTDLFRTRFPKKYKCIFYPQVELTHFSGQTDKYGLMSEQLQVSYLLYLRKIGNYYLFVYISLLSIKYILLLAHSLIKKRDDKNEALGFFRSLKYLGKILRYPKGYGTLPTSLKIDKIPD